MLLQELLWQKFFYPESKENKINRNLDLNKEDLGANAIHALARGASDGLKTCL